MKTIIALALCSLLAGCCHGPEIVYVPVSSCIEPPSFYMPELKVNQLSEKPGTQQAIEAIANDHRTLKSHLKQCITLLDGYRKVGE